jgi:endonuclease/exonuclease/phosphatase (EEP) superfamily protein YafD
MTVENRTPERKDGVALLTIVTYGLIAVGVLALFVRYWRFSNIVVLAAIAFVPYLMLAPVLALMVALIRRSWISVAIATVVVVACAATQLPHYLADDPPRHAVEVTVMTINVRDGAANAPDVVKAVKAHHVDLLMLTEFSWVAAKKLGAAGLGKELRYVSGRAGWMADGTAVFSRYPVENRRLVRSFHFAATFTRVLLPTVHRPVYAAAVHPPGPLHASSWWRHDIAAVPPMLRAMPAGTVIVGGDFNSTPDNVWFRDIVATPGFANANDQAGAGLIPTYPAQHLVPLIGIDHVLTRHAVAMSVEPISIAGTDHRGIIAKIAIPRK